MQKENSTNIRFLNKNFLKDINILNETISKDKLVIGKIYLETRGKTNKLLLLVSFSIINNTKYCIFVKKE